MKTGIELIAEERQRQIAVEGWTAEHDAQHTDGELAVAASVYADFANYHGEFTLMDGSGKAKVLIGRDFKWPFEKELLKLTPDNRVRELQKAGALIAAEIDRLQPQQIAVEESEKELEERTERNMNLISDFLEHLEKCENIIIPESAVLSFFNA